ncbi:MAG: pentapeptide repeat-containing protein [Anaerolineae bacterium]|nr:pentapeptide repeat-containing protein [Anaerolineae bacterium]
MGKLILLTKYKFSLIRILLVAVLLLLALWANWLEYACLVIGRSPIGLFFTHMLVKVGAEFAGIAIAVVTIDYLNEKRQEKEHIDQLKRELSSHDPGIVQRALNELKARKKHSDGTLKGVSLLRANWTNVLLPNADLEGAYLGFANFENAILIGANLAKTMMDSTILHKCHLEKANMAGSTIIHANLEGVYLSEAILEGVKFINTNMKGAILAGVETVFEQGLVDALATFGEYPPFVLKEANVKDAWFVSVDLTNAHISEQQLLAAAFISYDTIMPDGKTYEEWEQRKERGQSPQRKPANYSVKARKYDGAFVWEK